MDDKKIGLSRRKMLAGLGAVGVASAGAGLGTTAYFSDEEGFAGNSLTAGELDLKLDYRATYNGGPGRLEEIQEYYPDFDVVEEGDGVYLLGEVPASDSDAWEDVVREADFCHGDIADELVNGDEIPVFTLEDLKPGDYGEVTISLHICDNPAWMFMTGELTANDENTVTEPEAGSDGESDPATDDPISGNGELADAIETRLWYDENCNNVYEGSGEEGEVDVTIVMDISGSMESPTDILTPAKDGAKALVGELEDSDQGALVSYQTGATRDLDLTDMDSSGKTSLEGAIDGLDATGFTNIQGGVIYAAEELLGDESFSDNELSIDLTTNPSGNDRDGADKVMVLLTDGQANRRYDSNGNIVSGGTAARQAALDAANEAKDAGIRVFTIAYGSNADLALMQSMASSPDDAYDAGDINVIQQVFGQIAGSITGEQEIFQGSLAGLMDELGEGKLLDGNRTTEETDPYAGALTQCLGFEWWLPTDVGNEIQTDSVMFDIGFHAEQARHNPDPESSFGNQTA